MPLYTFLISEQKLYDIFIYVIGLSQVETHLFESYLSLMFYLGFYKTFHWDRRKIYFIH